VQDNSFYQDIDKFIKHNIDITNSAKSLADMLDEFKITQDNLKKKEELLGLKDTSKLFGKKIKKANNVFIYTTYSDNKQFILSLINKLEHYPTLSEDEQLKLLHIIKDDLEYLKTLNISIEHYIINKTRFETWNKIENDFSLTLQNLNIRSFMQHLELMKVKYQKELLIIKNYYEDREDIYKEIYKIRNNEQLYKDEKDKQISKQYNILNKEIDPSIAPLLKDTAKLIEKIDIKLETLPKLLNEKDKKSFEEFIPAISEYFIDQTYALSGGYSYTDLSNRLQHIQELINKNAVVGVLLEEIDKLNDNIEHLYLLHWIVESILKNILKCFEYSCSLGRTCRAYSHNYSKTDKTNMTSIIPAIKIRNNIAHSGLIWAPDEISMAIKTYRNYLLFISKEQYLDLYKVNINKQYRKLSKEDKDKMINESILKYFQYSKEQLYDLDSKLYKSVEKKLEKNHGFLSKNDTNEFKKKIKKLKYIKKQKEKDEFAYQYFGFTYKEVEDKLIAHYLKTHTTYNKDDKETRNKAFISGLYWAYNESINQTTSKNGELQLSDTHKKDISPTINKIKKVLELYG